MCGGLWSGKGCTSLLIQNNLEKRWGRVPFFLFSTFCSSFHPLNAMYKLNVGPHSGGFVIQKRVNGMEACINLFTEFMFPILYCIILREKHCC